MPRVSAGVPLGVARGSDRAGEAGASYERCTGAEVACRAAPQERLRDGPEFALSPRAFLFAIAPGKNQGAPCGDAKSSNEPPLPREPLDLEILQGSFFARCFARR